MNEQPAPHEDPTAGSAPIVPPRRPEVFGSWQDMRVEIWGPRRSKPRPAGRR